MINSILWTWKFDNINLVAQHGAACNARINKMTSPYYWYLIGLRTVSDNDSVAYYFTLCSVDKIWQMSLEVSLHLLNWICLRFISVISEFFRNISWTFEFTIYIPLRSISKYKKCIYFIHKLKTFLILTYKSRSKIILLLLVLFFSYN